MEHTVPEGSKISEAVAMFLVQTNNQKILPERRKQMINLATKMWSDTHIVYDMKSIHARLCVGDAYAGEYRQSIIIKSSGDIGLYPKSCALQTLMNNYFYPSYHNVLTANVPSDHRLEDVAWYLGAIGRCIRPFYKDNLPIFWLVENQARIRFGLPISSVVKPKNVFEEFRAILMGSTFRECYV